LLLEFESRSAQCLHGAQSKNGNCVAFRACYPKGSNQIGIRVGIRYPKSPLNLLSIHENAERSGGAGAARESFEIEYVLLRAPRSRYYVESFRGKFGAQAKFVRRGILIGSTGYDQENGRIRKGARRNCQYDN